MVTQKSVWAAAVDDPDWALRVECRSTLVPVAGQEASVDDPPNVRSVTIGLVKRLLHTIVDPVLDDGPWRLTPVFGGVVIPAVA